MRKNDDKKVLNYVVIIFFAAAIFGFLMQKYGKKTILYDRNGETYAYVKNENTIEEAFKKAELKTFEGKTIKKEDILQRKDFAFFKKNASEEELAQAFAENLPKYEIAWVVYKNGTPICGLKNRGDILDMLSQLKTFFVSKVVSTDTRVDTKITELDFIDRIEIKSASINSEKVLSKSEFYTKILKATKETAVEVSENMKDEPTVVSNNMFSLNIEIRDKKTENIKLPQTTIVNYDETLEKGKRIVDRSGTDGKLVRESENRYINGQIVSSSFVKETVEVEPNSEIVRVGDRDEALKVRFIWPAIGIITSGFGPRYDGFHRGLDIAAYLGSTVRASYEGTVTFAGRQGSYGNVVIIEHKDGYETRYAHLLKPLVKTGERVEQNEAIGQMGSTGNSTGPHVHFEILKNGELLNPEDEL